MGEKCTACKNIDIKECEQLSRRKFLRRFNNSPTKEVSGKIGNCLVEKQERAKTEGEEAVFGIPKSA
ncbi:MAG: hypothetical protein V1697_00845 [Candidatus Levyibacteriota bacterium]